MCRRFFCSKMPAGLMFSFFVFLLPSVLTQTGNTTHIYFSDEGDNIPLKGPDNPGNGPVVWEWKPHSGQAIQRLVTFQKESSGQWVGFWNCWTGDKDTYNKTVQDGDNIDLEIRNPSFKLAGLFTLTQTQLSNKTLKLYEVFGVKIESSPQSVVVGSDVTLSCTISKLSDTVSLQWKQGDSSQQNRRNTDQIRLNNTVYLIVRHVAVEDQELHVCEVQENGSIILTGKAHFSVSHTAAWTWISHNLQNQEKNIATALKSQPIDVNKTYFESRLVPTVGNFNGMNFSVRIVPVLFDDAGVYTCSLESSTYVTIKLITVKVTAEPSDAVTEGDTITLTCSVSDVTESMRLVWISSDGKTVGEKTLNGRNGEEKSLRLIIEKADRGRGNWRCALFYQNRPQVLVPYNLEPSDDYTFKPTNVVIFGSLALLLIIILAVVLCLRKRKVAGLGNQRQKPLQPGENIEDASQLYSNANEIQQMQGLGNQKPLQPGENIEDASQLYSNANKIQQMQGDNEMPVPETSHFAEHATVNRKAKEDGTEREDIHYGSIAFQKNSPGSRHDTQCNKQSSDTNLAPSKEDDSSVIYAQITQAEYK
uniref:vascular cell adhesion protein 1-like isoform X2 n=1 Tax=Pristiophorus japonicus TaxID=55135 RepID=UPI00398F4673